MTDTGNDSSNEQRPLCELRVADSVFLGFVCSAPARPAVERHRRDLIAAHPAAAHVPHAALALDGTGAGREEVRDDGGEPAGASVGATLIEELRRSLDGGGGPPGITAVVVVRYFGTRFLGVTCGRLHALVRHRHTAGSISKSSRTGHLR